MDVPFSEVRFQTDGSSLGLKWNDIYAEWEKQRRREKRSNEKPRMGNLRIHV